MGKAVLILEKMPESCAYCPLYPMSNPLYGFCLSKEEYCPLREAPEQRTEKKEFTDHDGYMWDALTDEAAGYNKALKDCGLG